MEKTVKKEESNLKGILKLIFNIIFWVAIIGLAVLWIVELILVRSDKEPLFCISEEVHQYDDGIVEECNGLGYKVINYKRDSLTARQFGPFFMGIEE